MDTRNATGRAPPGAEGTDDFFMFRYKILTCPRRHSHDWTSCPYAHSGESARRRDPSVYRPIPCPESKSGRPCPRGDSCKYAHNDFEYWLHPTRYCTEYCKQGPGCKRKVCFFAHKPSELRKPADIIQTLNAYGWLNCADQPSGRHERKSSLSSIESSETGIPAGLCYQSSGSICSIESLMAQGASPSSYGSDLDLGLLTGSYAADDSPRMPLTGRTASVEEPVVGGGMPHGPIGCIPEAEAKQGFGSGCCASVSPAVARKQVLDEVTNALAGCSADASILDSMDPSIFLSASTGPSPRKSASSRNPRDATADRQPQGEVRNERVAACLKILMDELRTGEGEDASMGNLGAAVNPGVESRLTGNGQMAAGRLDRLMAQSLTTVTGVGQRSVDGLRGDLFDCGAAHQAPGVDPLLLDQLLKTAANDNVGGGRCGLYPQLAFPQVGWYGMTGRGVGNAVNAGGDLSAPNGIIASLGTSFGGGGVENDALKPTLGSVPYGNYAIPSDVAATSAASMMGLSQLQAGAIGGHPHCADPAQVAISNWDLARSLGLVGIDSLGGLAGPLDNLLGASPHPLATGAQEGAPERRLRSGVETGRFDDLIFGMPEALALCR